MMKINTKWVLLDFSPYEYKYLEKYLEDMALKGWKLQDIIGGFLKFKRSEPKKIKYSVDIMNRVSFFDGKNSDVALDYREYCSVAGWDFVCERDKIQVYCSENEIESIPIHTDENEKFNSILKASSKYTLLNLFTLSMILFMQYTITIGNYDAMFLASNLLLGSLLIAGIFTVHELIGIVSFVIWVINGKISLNKSEEVSYDYFIAVKIRRFIRNVILTVAICTMLFMIINGENYGLKFIVGIVLISGAIYLSMKFVSKGNYNYKKKRVINIISYGVILILGLIIMRLFIFSSIFSWDRMNNEDVNRDKYILTLKDFDDEPKEGGLLYINEDSSFLASSLFYSDNGRKVDLMYELFQSKYKWVIDYNFNKQMDWFNGNNIKYTEINTDLIENIKVYRNENSGDYIIVSDNTIIEISSWDKNLSEDELLDIIYEKVFK